LLRDLIVGWPWATKIDWAVALAAILTAVLRGAFQMAPVFLLTAPKAASGKSFFVDLVAHIVTGRWAPVISLNERQEEGDKQLGALLLEGPPIISLDNLMHDLGGALLNQMTERPTVKIRILGKSQAPDCEWRGVLFATGNNRAAKGETIRRTLIANIVPEVEHPETRKFDFNPIERVMADRGLYVAAALTIARAYKLSGEKRNEPPLASYEEWCRFVREPLLWLGEADPVKSQEAMHEEDEEQVNDRALILTLVKMYEGKSDFKVVDVIQAAAFSPDLKTLLVARSPRRGKDETIDRNAIGQWFKTLKGQVFAIAGQQYRLIRTRQDDKHGNRWKVEKMGG
jgi:hypothetical protein